MAGPRLTSMAVGGGCACKLPAADLAEVLQGLPVVTDARVLAGTTGFDDAAVVSITGDIALVQTVDFFTPLVDDPFDFGRIAATNAISDVYAMGGEPLCALAIAGFPRDLDPDTVRAVFAGGAAAASEAGIAIVGGHTIVDPEPKYGLVVSGTVRPDAIWRNAGGQAGDVLVLTKALGTGVVANALRADAVPADVLAAAVASMTTLNREGARALRAAGRAARRHRRDRVRPGRPPARAGRGLGPDRAAAACATCRCCRACSTWPARATCRADRAATARRPMPTRPSPRATTSCSPRSPATPRRRAVCSPPCRPERCPRGRR